MQVCSFSRVTRDEEAGFFFQMHQSIDRQTRPAIAWLFLLTLTGIVSANPRDNYVVTTFWRDGNYIEESRTNFYVLVRFWFPSYFLPHTCMYIWNSWFFRTFKNNLWTCFGAAHLLFSLLEFRMQHQVTKAAVTWMFISEFYVKDRNIKLMDT